MRKRIWVFALAITAATSCMASANPVNVPSISFSISQLAQPMKLTQGLVLLQRSSLARTTYAAGLEYPVNASLALLLAANVSRHSWSDKATLLYDERHNISSYWDAELKEYGVGYGFMFGAKVYLGK